MNKLTFEFTVEETNVILEALGDMPFSKVFGLINTIQQQAGTQLNGQQDNMGKPNAGKGKAPKIDKMK